MTILAVWTVLGWVVAFGIGAAINRAKGMRA